MKKFISLLILCCSLSATFSQNYIDPIYGTTTLQKVKYIQKGVISPSDTGRWMHIYTPVTFSDERKPVVIVMSGGGGSITDPMPVHYARDVWAARGYIGVAIEYKATIGQFTPDEQRQSAQEAQTAIRYLRAHKSQYGIKGQYFFIMGQSAGAITAEQCAKSANDQDDPYFSSSPLLKQNEKAKNYVLASATLSGACNTIFLKFIDPDDPPNYAYHGTRDVTVSYAGAVTTYKTDTSFGIPSTLMSFPTDHNLGNGPTIEADLVPKFARLVTGGSSASGTVSATGTVSTSSAASRSVAAPAASTTATTEKFINMLLFTQEHVDERKDSSTVWYFDIHFRTDGSRELIEDNLEDALGILQADILVPAGSDKNTRAVDDEGEVYAWGYYLNDGAIYYSAFWDYYFTSTMLSQPKRIANFRGWYNKIIEDWIAEHRLQFRHETDQPGVYMEKYRITIAVQ